MKKLTLIFVLLLCSYAYGQESAAAFKLGSFMPEAAGAGFIIGYEGGSYIDDNFNFGWSIDWFHKNYVDKTLAESFNEVYGVSGDINELRATTNLHNFPLMISVTAKFPVAPRAKIYGTGGVGVEVLIINYRNIENPDDSELKGAFDFNWRIGLGAAYDIGARSEILLEMTYHNSQPSWTFEADVEGVGTRTFERVYDMSGVMIRAGFRFFY
jgi:opacity protein-like surface antigen